MAKRPVVSTVPQTVTNTGTINTNFSNIQAAFDNTLSRDGSTPNQMLSDIDLNGNDLLNVGVIDADFYRVNGQDIDFSEPSAAQLAAEAARDAAIVARNEAQLYDGPKVDNFDDLATVTPAQLPVGGFIRVIQTGAVYQRVASGGHLDYTGTGGLRLNVLPWADGYFLLHFGEAGAGGDDTAVFQRAASALPNGARFRVGPGAFSVSDSITFAAERLSIDLTGSQITQTGANKKTLNFTNATECKVFGGELIGRGTEHNGASSSYNGVAAIYFSAPQNCLVDGVVISNHAGGSIRFVNADGLIVKNCVISGIGAGGGIDPLDNNGDFAIGSRGSTADANITVENCRIFDTCFGVGASRGSGLFVRGNFFENTPGQHHIYASAMSDMIVSDNYFGPCAGEAVKNQIAASSDIDTDNIVISGNVFKSIGQSCIAIAPSADATVGRHKGILVSDNLARGVGNYFAVIRRCDRGDIVDNVIEQVDANALDLQDWRGRVVGNTIRDGDWYAIYATVNGDCDFSGNIIQDVALNASGKATALRYQVMAFITASSGTGHRVEWRDNVMKMGSTPTHLSRALRSSSSVNIALDGGANLSGYAHFIQGMTYNSGQHSPNVDNVVSSTLNPTTPIYGRGKRDLYGTQNPATASMTATFRQGDICWNTTPSAGGTVGWVCTADGTPGTWRAFGAISV